MRASKNLPVVLALCLALCAAAYGAQDNKEKEKAKRPAPQHSAPRENPQQQRHAAPPEQPRSAPPQVQHQAPVQTPQNSNPTPNVQRQAPAQTPQQQPTQAAPAGGRRFGSNPDATRPSNTVPNATPNSDPNRRTNPGSFNDRPPRTNPGQPYNQPRPDTNNSTPPRTSPSASPMEGRRFGNGAPPTVVRTQSGATIQRSPGGMVREVRTPSGAVIRHTPGGYRTVEVVRPGGRVIVTNSVGHGYIQRPVVVSGRSYVQRTYYVSGVPYVRAYRPYRWGGVNLVVYTAPRYYPASFYTWGYSPWVRPVHYGWGWYGSPWYSYWGGWFTPYPVYSSPALWLTDYMVAATLEEAYRERQAAAADRNAYSGGGSLTPETKDAIAAEVRRQLEQERAEQQNPNYQPTLFGGGGEHVFVAGASLLVNSPGGECALTEGDVVQLNGMPPLNSESVDVMVLASKGNDCRKGALVNVAIADLQEMQNHMRATLDQGLTELRSKQGQGEMPSLPREAAGPPMNSAAAEMAPDSNAAAELSQQAREADRAEQAVVSEAGNSPSTISLGQTTREVLSIMGQPVRTVDLGAKQIYVYKDLKITFIDGKVSDVQ